MKNKLLTGALCVFVSLLVVTVSIALPIYVRPFYYLQIDALGIPDATGMERAEIVAAYDEVLDYLTIPGREFGTGAFPHSAEGAAHFADCKVLFDLNATVLVISFVAVILLCFLLRCNVFQLSRFRGHHPMSVCGGGILCAFAAVGGLAALNFDGAFKVFHAIFFHSGDFLQVS